MNVVLIGFKGVGKSTLGRVIARRLGRPFVDLDSALEDKHAARTGRRLSFREIFRALGEEAFRALEEEVASELLEADGRVVALGGGTPLVSDALREKIGRQWVLYVTLDKKRLFERIKASGLPAFFDPADPRGSFERLWAEREPVYLALASHTVDTTGRTPEEAADEVLASLPDPGAPGSQGAAGLSPLQWYALRTKSRHEQRVADRLAARDYHVFLPTVEAWSRRKDRKKRIRQPMFPGYLFVECELTKERWLEIVNTPGAANLLGYESKPTPVPEEQVSSIQKVVEAGVHVRYHPYIETGDRVKVVDGPLRGAEGIMVGVNERAQRLVISVDLLSRSVEVELEGWAVQRL